MSSTRLLLPERKSKLRMHFYVCRIKRSAWDARRKREVRGLYAFRKEASCMVLHALTMGDMATGGVCV